MDKNFPAVPSPDPGKGQFLVYEAEDGQIKIDVRLVEETVWLNHQHMTDLFQATKQNISFHTQRIFEVGMIIFMIFSIA